MENSTGRADYRNREGPIQKVSAAAGGILSVTFDTGSTIRADLARIFPAEKYKKIEDPAVWQSVRTENGSTVVWEQDGTPVVTLRWEELIHAACGIP